MVKTQLNLEKSVKPQKTIRISFSAFIFFVIIYVYLFPSTLFNDTKFWFFISNAIVLIVAADSGAFSSLEKNNDMFEEFLIKSRARSTAASIVAESMENGTKGDLSSKGDMEAQEERMMIEARCYRSKSEKAITVVGQESKRIMQRLETDEFSTMSDEELNRRAEEFIRRFNIQIRLQERPEASMENEKYKKEDA